MPAFCALLKSIGTVSIVFGGHGASPFPFLIQPVAVQISLCVALALTSAELPKLVAKTYCLSRSSFSDVIGL